MANYHKLSVIGRVLGDIRYTPFENGAVAKFGLPINFTARKKNPQTGEWEGESFIINVDAFNSTYRKLADLVQQYLKKGSLVFVEGRLKQNEYKSNKTGQMVTTIVLVADNIQFLDGREPMTSEEDGEARFAPARSQVPTAQGARGVGTSRPAPAASQFADEYEELEPTGRGGYNRNSTSSGNGLGNEEELPF